MAFQDAPESRPFTPSWRTIIGVADQIDPLVDALAVGGRARTTVRPFAAEEPLHPVQCHIRQQGGGDPALWAAGVRWRVVAEFDHPRFEPSSDRGGEDRQSGQERSVADIVERDAIRMPPSTTRLIPTWMRSMRSR